MAIRGTHERRWRVDPFHMPDYGPAPHGGAAMSLNKVMLIGNLGKDPELRFTPSGRAVARFSLATSEQWTTPEGQKQERTEWHNVVVWGKQAESCGQYLSKGRQVFVEGSIRSRSYDDKDGNKKYITEIVARDVRFLGGAGGAGGGGGGARVPQEAGVSAPPGEDVGAPPADDDIPF
jgi:single-strand DNA-binding protein